MKSTKSQKTNEPMNNDINIDMLLKKLEEIESNISNNNNLPINDQIELLKEAKEIVEKVKVQLTEINTKIINIEEDMNF